MSRPKKNYCDYFSHDRDMRNHRKIKALRTKFGIIGYGIWVMFLEFLTGNDNNVFKNNDVELELLSGDFGVSVEEIKQVLDYCIKMNLLVENEGLIYSESLDERLISVYKKRSRSKAFSEQQPRKSGQFDVHNAAVNGVSVTESPQSKVKEIKVNKSKIESIEKTPAPVLENSNLFRKPVVPSKDEVWEVFSRGGGTKEMAKSFYDKYESTGWFLNGSPVTNFTALANRFISNWKENEKNKNKHTKAEFDPTKVKIKLK